MNIDPLVIMTVLAVMGVTASLTFAVWRAVTRPAAGESFDDALDTIRQGSELTTAEMVLRVEGRKNSWSWFEWWADAAEQAGRDVKDPQGLGRVMLGASLIGLIFGLLVYPTGISSIFIPFVIIGFTRLWLMLEQGKRRAAFDRQLPLLLSSLRTQIHAGMTVQAAIMMVADDMPSPLGDEIRQIRDEVNVSVPLERALNDMSGRVGSRLVQFLVSSIGIAIQSGSDLVPQLITIEEIVRQRARIAGKIKAAIALAKPTSYLALAAPPSMFVWMMFQDPDYVPYFLGEGLLSLFVAIVLYVAGVVSIRIMVSNVEKI